VPQCGGSFNLALLPTAQESRTSIVRLGGRQASILPRLLAVAALTCALVPVAALASSARGSASVPTAAVSIELPPATDQSPDGWVKPPLIVDLMPEGPGVVLYRFGAGPGPWQRCYGPVIVPPGKQTMSTVLIGPDGTPGPVATVTTRSDVHALAYDASTAPSGLSQATYSGVPSTTGIVSVTAVVGRQLGTVVRRLGGTDRYDTSAIISANEPSHSSTVIIATGQKFPDALTASGLAGCLNSPVLLVARTEVPPATIAEIRRLGAKHAIICGGTPSVGLGVVRHLRALGLSVERLAGATRYETAIAVAQRIQKITGKHSRVFIARGDFFADALIVSPLAYRTCTPILLSGTDKLWDNTAAQLTKAKYASATIIGGGMGLRAENGVRHRIGTVDRWSGTDQYDTSVVVAADSVLDGSESWGYVGLARGDIFPDALCGGVLAGKQSGVILLTPPTVLDSRVADALTAHTADIRKCDVYGSDQAISQAVYNQISAIFH